PDTRGAPAPRPRPRRGRRRPRHVRPVAPRAARDHLRAPRRPDRGRAARHPAHQLRIQVRGPPRGRPRLRRPLHAEPVLRTRAPPAVGTHRRGAVIRHGPADRLPVRVVPPRVPRLRPAGVRVGGQDPPDDRDRVHGRLPPLDRHRRRARRLAARAGRSGRRVPPGARPGMKVGRGFRANGLRGPSPRGPLPRAPNLRPTLRGTNLRTWLRPGMGIKRWLLLVFAGELAFALGGAFALRQLYRDTDIGGPLQGLIYVVTLQFLGYVARGVILGSIGLALFVIGSIKVIQALMDPLRSSDGDQPLVRVIYQKRFLARGPRIVA